MKYSEVDPHKLLSRLEKVCDPQATPPSVSEIKFSGLPITGFVFGSLCLLTLFLGRVISILAYFFLPFVTALTISLFWVFINVYINEKPVQSPGIIAAFPATRLQSKVIEALKPFLDYEPPWWCLDNHYTTILPVVMFRPVPRISIRQRFTADDGAPLWLDWKIPSKPIKGMILTIPGLNGSSKGGYIVDLMERLSGEGFAVAVLNGRGAGRTAVFSIETSFHLGRPSDLMQAVSEIHNLIRDENIPIYIVGYSAGGVRAVNFAGVYGDTLAGKIKGIVSFGGIVKNDRTYSSRMSTVVYQPVIIHAFASTMYSKFVPHLKGHTEEHIVHKIFHERYYTSFAEYDRNVTARIHNLTLDQYNDQILAKHQDKWKTISVPTLIVHACDDPVLHVDDAVVPEIACGNSHVMYLVTAKGGHIGWPIGSSEADHGYKWMSDVVLSYFSAL